MAYSYSNGFRYRTSGKGYHTHKTISEKLGRTVSTIDIHVDSKVQAGVYIPLNVTFKEVLNVTLNNFKLQNIYDYIIKDNSRVAFTFSVRKGEKIKIEGVL